MAGPRSGVVIVARAVVVYAKIGEEMRARDLLREVLDDSRRRSVYPALIAQVDAALGDRESALTLLERFIEDLSLVASWLRAPEMDLTRPDPRFTALSTRFGLKP